MLAQCDAGAHRAVSNLASECPHSHVIKALHEERLIVATYIAANLSHGIAASKGCLRPAKLGLVGFKILQANIHLIRCKI